MVRDLVVWVQSMETEEGSGGRVSEAVVGEGRLVGSRDSV